MKKFFYPSSIVVFGVADNPRNLAKNILSNCKDMGFSGKLYAVGKKSGTVHGLNIIDNPNYLPKGIDLAVILVPARYVTETIEICGQKGIRRVIISTGGFRELGDESTDIEKDLVLAAKKYDIRFIGPNCIGIICTDSKICTPFTPMQYRRFKKGTASLIVQSGGDTTQSAYHFSDEHIGFSKIISAGNKLNINEIDFIQYLMNDKDTEQIHLYLESIEDGRELIRLAKSSNKPVIIFKSNVSHAASQIAKSHTAALSNNDKIVDGAFKQAGIIRAKNIQDLTIAARALKLPPLKGNRLVAISLSGGFSVILGDACESYGFECPALPRELMKKIEGFRRGGVIHMSNPMDFGDIHDIKALVFTLEHCLALNYIDGLILSFMYEPEMAKMFGDGIGSPEQILRFFKKICQDTNKPIALSFFSVREYIEEFKRINTFPVFNDSVESVRAMWMLREYWRLRNA